MKFTVICLLLLLAFFAGASYANLETGTARAAQVAASDLPAFIQLGKKYECDSVVFTVAYTSADNGWVKVISVSSNPKEPNAVVGEWVNVANFQVCRQIL